MSRISGNYLGHTVFRINSLSRNPKYLLPLLNSRPKRLFSRNIVLRLIVFPDYRLWEPGRKLPKPADLSSRNRYHKLTGRYRYHCIAMKVEPLRARQRQHLQVKGKREDLAYNYQLFQNSIYLLQSDILRHRQ